MISGTQGHRGQALQLDNVEQRPQVQVRGTVAVAEAGSVAVVSCDQGEGGPAHGRAQPAAFGRAAACHTTRSGKKKLLIFTCGEDTQVNGWENDSRRGEDWI